MSGIHFENAETPVARAARLIRQARDYDEAAQRARRDAGRLLAELPTDSRRDVAKAVSSSRDFVECLAAMAAGEETGLTTDEIGGSVSAVNNTEHDEETQCE